MKTGLTGSDAWKSAGFANRKRGIGERKKIVAAPSIGCGVERAQICQPADAIHEKGRRSRWGTAARF
jgi:hypothetical protein